MKNKYIKKAMGMVLSLVMAVSVIHLPGTLTVKAASGTAFKVDGGNIYFDQYTGYITGADKTITEAVIPDKIDGVTVKGIRKWAFYEDHELTAVTLPDTIVDMEQGAFYGADALRSITIPSGISEISDQTFYGCSALESVSMPAGLEQIGRSAFYNCTSLKYVDIPGTVYRLGDLAFYGCSGLYGVYFVEGSSVEMGTWCFNNCYNLERVVNCPDARWEKFIESCKRARRFMEEEDLAKHTERWRLNLKTDTPEEVKAKEKAFDELAKKIIDEDCAGTDTSTDRGKALAISRWLVKRIRYNTEHFDAYNPADNYTAVWDVYQGLMEKEEEAEDKSNPEPYATTCGGYSNMTQVLLQTLGIPVATVYRQKKQGETIDHEYNMIYLDGKWCFADTTASDDSKDDTYMQEIEWLDAGVAGFAYSSDHRTDQLLYSAPGDSSIYINIPSDIEIEPEEKDWPDQNPSGAYVKGNGHTDPDWERKATTDEKEKEQALIEKRKGEFPEVSESPSSIFKFDSAKGQITGVTDNSVTEISIPETIDGVSVTSIGKEAFSGLSQLVTVIMPDSITELGAGAFTGCRSLKYVRLSEGITEIRGAVYSSDDDSLYEMESANGTFSGCSSLESIIIPENVTRLGGYIFSGCDSLEEILFENYEFKEKCIATDPRGSDDDYASGAGNISWYAFKGVGRALNGLDFHDTYKRTKWHRALQNVALTDNWRQNILDIYDSQLDYREGFSPYYVGGNNTKQYKTPAAASYWEWGHFSEAGKFHGIDGTTWCYAFTQWVYAMAGIPLDLGSKGYVQETSYGKVTKECWSQLSFAGGSYMPQPGDIIGVGKSHVAMIGEITEGDTYVDIRIINGNHPNRNVGKELVRYEKATGRALKIYDEETKEFKDLADDADGYKIRSVYCPKLENIKAHTLTLDPCEGKAAITERIVTEGGVYGALPDAVREGYEFDGWYTDKTGGEKVLPYETFKGNGDQTLYARYTESKGTPLSITPIFDSVTVKVKEKKQLGIIFTPHNPADTSLSFRSSNTDVVTVDSDGIVKGKAEGEAVIEIRPMGSADSAYVTVKVTSSDSSGGSSNASSDVKEYVIDSLTWKFDTATGTIVSIPDKWTGGEIPSVIGDVAVKAIGDTAGRGNKNVKYVIIPEGVETIGDYVFASAPSLKSLTLPSTLKTIGQYAFRGCDGLSDIVFGCDRNKLKCGYMAFEEAIYNHPDLSDPYKSGPYYNALMEVELTGDFVKDAIAIASSQEGYHDGDSFEDLDGLNTSGTGEFCEMNYFKDSPDWLWHPESYGYYRFGGWCGIFCQWVYALAGAPPEVMDVFAWEHELSHTWDTTIYAGKGGSYELKTGDLIHFDYGHYAIVTDYVYQEADDKITITTWNGNPDVALKDYEFEASTGKYLKDMGNGKDYYLAWVVPVDKDAALSVTSYNVSFDPCKGTTDKASKKVYDGASYGILPSPVREGYTFLGWYTDKSGRGDHITPYCTVSLEGDITLYAAWKGEDGKIYVDPDDGAGCECDSKGSHNLEKVVSVEPDCENEGNVVHYKCKDCGRIFASETGRVELRPEDVIRPAGHSLLKIPAKKATEDEEGYYAYYKCEKCGKLFSDAEGKKEIDEPVVIPKGQGYGSGGGSGQGESGGTDSPGYYEVDEDGYITRWNVYNVSVADIPEKVGDVTVKGIKDDSFAFGTRTALEEIKFPQTLEYIGKYSFWTCINLKELNIPDTVTYIGQYAFGIQNGRAEESKLSKVTIGNKTEKIDKYAFFNCSSLEEVVIGSGIKTIESYAFFNCTSLKTVTINAKSDEVTIKNGAIPSGVNVIYKGDEKEGGGDESGKDKVDTGSESGDLSGTGAEISPDDKGKDAGGADSGTGTEKGTGADAGTSVGDNTGSSKTTGSVDETVPPVGTVIETKTKASGTGNRDGGGVYKVIATDENTTPEVSYTAVVNKKATTVVIPSSVTDTKGTVYRVTEIGNDAFKGSAVKTVTIPKSVEVVNDGAFSGTKSLTEVKGGTGIEKIGNKAFYGSKKLKKIVISAKVRYIGKNAFNGCKSLTSLTVKTKKLTLKTVGTNAFKGVPKTAKVKVPKSKKKLYTTIFRKRGLNKKVKIK